MEKVSLDTLVDDIFFDVRIRSCLRRYYVKTLRQLVAISCIGILKMHELDKKSRTVIEVWLEARGLHLEMTKEEIAEYEGVPAKAEEEKEEVLFSDSKGNVLYSSGDDLAVKVHDLAKEILLAELKMNNIGDDEFLAESSVRLARLFYKELKKQMTI